MPVMQETIYTSNSGFAMQQLAGRQLMVWSRQPNSSFELNTTASLIWRVCNGSLTVSQIVDHLQSLDPEQSDRIGRDVLETLNDFQAKGLIRPANQDEPRRMIKRVGFCNFWDGFDIRDNYFLWMLSFRFDVQIVNLSDSDIDLVFFSDVPSFGFDHSRVNRETNSKIQVCIDNKPDFDRCDYAFSSKSVQGAYANGHFRLPSWALYLDWNKFSSSKDVFRNHSDFEPYNPRAAASCLAQALFPD